MSNPPQIAFYPQQRRYSFPIRPLKKLNGGRSPSWLRKSSFRDKDADQLIEDSRRADGKEVTP
jgi:hypothetical protein